jgi:hypothetical protein
MNGRGRDNPGHFTFVSKNGCSVIDYCIISHYLLTIVDSFSVHSEVIESSHFPLTLNLYQNVQKSEVFFNDEQINDEVWLKNINIFKWRGSLRNPFYNDIYSGRVVDMLMLGVDNVLSGGDTERANWLINSVFSMLGKEFKMKTPSKGRKNEWFDNECAALRKNAIKNLRDFRKYRSDENKEKYLQSKKIFKNTCKLKKQDWYNRWGCNVEELMASGNTKEAWNQIKKTKGM